MGESQLICITVYRSKTSSYFNIRNWNNNSFKTVWYPNTCFGYIYRLNASCFHGFVTLNKTIEIHLRKVSAKKDGTISSDRKIEWLRDETEDPKKQDIRLALTTFHKSKIKL